MQVQVLEVEGLSSLPEYQYQTQPDGKTRQDDQQHWITRDEPTVELCVMEAEAIEPSLPCPEAASSSSCSSSSMSWSFVSIDFAPLFKQSSPSYFNIALAATS